MTAPPARRGGTGSAAVTGIGLITPAGTGTQATWDRVTAGIAVATSDPALAGLPVDMSCRVTDFDPDELLGRRAAWRLDRCVQFALVAAREAVADSGLDRLSWDPARVGVVMGTAFGGTATFEQQHQVLISQGPGAVSPMLVPMMLANIVSGQIAIDLGARGPNLVTATACASGTTAVGTALLLIRSGACDVVIAGGSEAALTPAVMAGFAQMGALSRRTTDPATASRPFDAERDGFVAAEGAAVLVLERPAHARARRAPIRASISGFGSSADAHHVTAPDPSGRGAESALRAALADAGLSSEEVTHVNAHGTSTRLNDATEATLIARVLPAGPAVTSTKGVTGHALGAAGAIEAALTVLSVQHGITPPTANLGRPDVDIDVVTHTPRQHRIEAALSNSFGFGGQNAVLAITTS